jgi:Flp pilus assembly protein TadD
MAGACTPPPGPAEAPPEPRPAFGPPAPWDPGTAADPADRGRQYLAAGQPDRAYYAFAEAIARHPADATALSGMGVAAFRLGREDEASRLFERATEVAPRAPLAWNNLGAFRFARGEFGAARDAFRAAFALSGGLDESIRLNLEMAEARVSETVSTDGVITEFRMIRAGEGKYILADQTKP